MQALAACMHVPPGQSGSFGFFTPFQKGFAMLPTQSSVIDVREIAPRERHALIFGRFDALLPGEALQLVNDHDPQPLHHQFQARSAGAFKWAYLQQGPDLWRVLISKTEPAAAREDSCCSGGACGG